MGLARAEETTDPDPWLLGRTAPNIVEKGLDYIIRTLLILAVADKGLQFVA